MQNYFYFNRNPYINNIPKAFYSFQNQASRNIVSSSFNFNTLLNTAQKGINTINQIIPMYKQIKPIYQQAKSSFNSIKKYFNFPIFNQRNANRNNDNTPAPPSSKLWKSFQTTLQANQGVPSQPVLEGVPVGTTFPESHLAINIKKLWPRNFTSGKPKPEGGKNAQ